MKGITLDIPGIGKVSQGNRPGNNPAKNTGFTGEFSRLLSEHMEPETVSSAPSHGLPELDATYAAKRAQISGTASHTPDKISDTIDLLDRYAQGLADPDTTLRQAFDLLEEIGSQTQAINKDLEDTQNKDPRLKEIMSHLSTLVELEKIKINRGDYS